MGAFDYELATKQRIIEIIKEKKIQREDRKKIFYAFDDLIILKKKGCEDLREMNRRTFILGHEIFTEKMKWINDFMKSKGFEEDIFTDLNSFEACRDDYDYYYEYKTPTQYKQEEEARKAKKLAEEQNNTASALDD